MATFGQQPDLVLLAADVREVFGADLVTDTVTSPVSTIVTDTLTNTVVNTATLHVTWQVLQPIPFDYSVFFQAVTEVGDEWQVVAQVDTAQAAR